MSAIAALERAIDELQTVDVETRIGSAVLDELAAMRRQLDRLESLWLQQVNRVHLAGAASAEGYVTTAAFLRHVCHLAPGAARSRVDVAQQLQDRPAVADAFAEGAISYAHVKVITDALNPLPADLQADAQPVLVEAARRYDPGRVAQIARRLRHIVDPDGQAGLDERHRERRWLEIATTFDGMTSLQGLLDAESGQALRTALDALSKPAGEIDDRTPAQRRADALAELARQALDSAQLPEAGGERPHITVTVDIATLRHESTNPADLGPADAISGESARRISCDSIVTRIVTQRPYRQGLADQYLPLLYFDALPPPLRGPTHVLDVGRAARTATAAIRKALAVRDNGCVMPGCDRPPSRCEAHHIIHWADGGVTALHNMVLLCGFHHHFVHEHRWQVSIRSDGIVKVTPPLAATA